MSTLYLPTSIARNTEPLCGAIKNAETPPRLMLLAPGSQLDQKEVLERGLLDCQSFSLFKKYRVCLDPNANPRAEEWIVTKGFLSGAGGLPEAPWHPVPRLPNQPYPPAPSPPCPILQTAPSPPCVTCPVLPCLIFY